MKLWQKIAILLMAVMLPVMGVTMFSLVHIQARSMRQTDEDNMRYTLTACQSSVCSAAEQHMDSVRETTQRSIVQYFFSAYAAAARNENTYYSLVSEDNYLFNTSPYEPKAVVFNEMLYAAREESGQPQPVLKKTVGTNGEPVLIGGHLFSVGTNEYTAYLSMNTADTERKIEQMYLTAAGMILFACVLTAVLSSLLLKRITKPITKLTETAAAFAGGQYHLRSGYTCRDEVGRLSAAFDQMAEALEEKLHALREENERKQFLLGALSHELRTPMTSTIGYGESLLHMPLTEEQQRACAAKIVESGRRAEQLSQKMMDLVGLSAEQTLEKKHFAAEHLLSAVKDLFGEKIEISCGADELYGDEALLFSLISNLIQNALRASKGDEPVAVSVVLPETDTVRLSVRDNGCGISKEHIARLMEPFYRVDKARSRKAGGAGLGLSICKLIAEKHGGNLSIESEVGKGTTVFADIPMHTV